MIWTTQPRSNHKGLAVIERGQGPNVLLIHGVGLRSEAWAAQIYTLSQTYRVRAVDMPGHGGSDPLHMTTPTLADYADAIAECITEPTVVIGHSMGAMIALHLAARNNNVTGVAALNAIFQRSQSAHDAVRARAAALSVSERANVTPTLTRWFNDPTSDAYKACEHWLLSVSLSGYKAAYTVFSHENGPSADTLRSLKKPALFMTGADEPNSTPEMSQQMAALSPKGEAVVIKDAAHMMPMTHATEVNAHLLRFIEGCQ